MTLALRPDGSILPTWVSPNVRTQYGMTSESCCQSEAWDQSIHPDDRAAVLAARSRFPNTFASLQVSADHVLINESLSKTPCSMAIVGEQVYRIKDNHGEWRTVRERILCPPALKPPEGSIEATSPVLMAQIVPVESSPSGTPLGETSPVGEPTFATMDINAIADEAKAWCELSSPVAATKTWLQQEEFFRSILDAQIDCVVRYTADFKVRYANAAYCKFLGMNTSQIDDFDIGSLMNDRYRDYIVKQLSSLSADNPINHIEHSGVDSNGRHYWMRWTNRALIDADGKVSEILGVGRDVTEQKALEQALAKRTLTERRDIGNQLHDGVGQHLSAIGMLSASLENRLAKHLPSELESIQELRRLVADTRGQVRSLIRGLCLSEMDAELLPSAFKQLANEIQRLSPLQISIDMPEDLSVLDDQRATQVYQIARESVLNAMRHAGGSKVTVRLELCDEFGRLVVEDDGKGISSNRPMGDGAGIQIMRYRAESIGGTFSIYPIEGSGTQVCVTFPNGPVTRNSLTT